MKMNDFAKLAAARNASREPIRTTIREHWSEIEGAIKLGASNKAIAAQLKEEFRAPIGSTSGFNAALKFVMAEKCYTRPAKPTDSVLSRADISVDTVTAVTDTRRRMVWGDES
jgi:hypothetical protein